MEAQWEEYLSILTGILQTTQLISLKHDTQKQI
jgi:hypothetical protein